MIGSFGWASNRRIYSAEVLRRKTTRCNWSQSLVRNPWSIMWIMCLNPQSTERLLQSDFICCSNCYASQPHWPLFVSFCPSETLFCRCQPMWSLNSTTDCSVTRKAANAAVKLTKASPEMNDIQCCFFHLSSVDFSCNPNVMVLRHSLKTLIEVKRVSSFLIVQGPQGSAGPFEIIINVTVSLCLKHTI